MTRRTVITMIVVGSLVAACGSSEPVGLAETGVATAAETDSEPVSASASESATPAGATKVGTSRQLAMPLSPRLSLRSVDSVHRVVRSGKDR